MLEKAWKLLECVFLARVPRMTFPLKTIWTPLAESDAAYRKLSKRFVFESVISTLIGFWAPVMMIGLGNPGSCRIARQLYRPLYRFHG